MRFSIVALYAAAATVTLSQVVAAHMQLDILLFMHMKYCARIDNSKIMPQIKCECIIETVDQL